MKQAVFLFGLLMAIWLLCSGHYDPMLIGYGVLSCLVVIAIAIRLGIVDSEALPVHLAFRIVFYIPWLFKEIVVSNIAVARVILDPALPIRPRLLRVKASQSSEIAQVIHANSITLTPGTITLDIRGGYLLVHALTEESAEGVLGGEMDRRVAVLERRAIEAGGAA
ncbi:MAG: Na+/H+ antiporter subunit E [Deltaproteobacteria bacterium]|jgi:multicomponent Na+:H+ antiporter subunit E|nr:Na+/H+ antiporter subunit E [Deltaproteobacteria bacterium]MBW2499848.1 Na+/H+ antiporter subunit E [Deltaproteobacteria bacterium]